MRLNARPLVLHTIHALCRTLVAHPKHIDRNPDSPVLRYEIPSPIPAYCADLYRGGGEALPKQELPLGSPTYQYGHQTGGGARGEGGK